MSFRIFSFGGGVQSTACLILAARGMIPYETFVFANTGDDSENPLTLKYLHEVHKPYAEKHGLHIVEVEKRNRYGKIITLLKDITRFATRTINIPVRMLPAGAPGNRNCTFEWKIKPVAKWTKEAGATKEHPCGVGIGISTDEIHRMRDSKIEWQRNEYPLIDMRISRDMCHQIIKSEGFPPVPKSSCWFCPYKKVEDWKELRLVQPHLFDRAVALEAFVNDKRENRKRQDIFQLTAGAIRPSC